MIPLPEPGHQYVIGADPAEGNPTSDDSALCVIGADPAEGNPACTARGLPIIFAALRPRKHHQVKHFRPHLRTCRQNKCPDFVRIAGPIIGESP
jgi:hypothetical protein